MDPHTAKGTFACEIARCVFAVSDLIYIKTHSKIGCVNGTLVRLGIVYSLTIAQFILVGSHEMVDRTMCAIKMLQL
jgi:hypothetical protein